MQSFIVELKIGYEAFHVPSGQNVADPNAFFDNVSSPETLIKSVLVVALAMFSDVIIVSNILRLYTSRCASQLKDRYIEYLCYGPFLGG